MIGHSLGEYVAATVAGVWSLEDALMLVAERARLIEELPEGGMMGVALPDHEVRPLLRGGLCVGTLNGPGVTVVSGPPAALDALAAELAERGVVFRRLPARHAFHSAMMRPVAERLEALVRGVRLRPPAIPFVSNVTGEWIRASEATDPAYWARHLCETVRFADGVRTLAADRRAALLEVGPGHALRALVSQLDGWDGAPRPWWPRCATTTSATPTSPTSWARRGGSGRPAWPWTGPPCTTASGRGASRSPPTRSSAGATGWSRAARRPRTPGRPRPPRRPRGPTRRSGSISPPGRGLRSRRRPPGPPGPPRGWSWPTGPGSAPRWPAGWRRWATG